MQLRWAPDFSEDDKIPRAAGTKWQDLTAKDKLNMFAISISRAIPVIKIFWHSGISDSDIAFLGMKQMGGLQGHNWNLCN